MKRLLLLCSMVGLMLAQVPAQAAFQALRLPQQAPAPALDGVLDEEIWRQAPVFDDFYEIQPQDLIAAKVRTEVRIVYDGRYLYVGLKAFEPELAGLRAPYARRDKTSPDQDFLALYIDPTGSKKSAQFIYLNPRGAVSDGVFTDAAGEDYSPDFDFQVATARFEGGWSAEVRIPLSSLAYSRDATSPWNLLVMRNRSREQRYRMLSAPLPRNNNCMLCFAEPITGLHDLPAGLNWSATPQLVLRGERDDVAGAPRRSASSRTLSLDLKLRPDPGTTIDATLKPDFSQVELDTPQLSTNSQFGLFVPEKRPFFLDGADIFQTPFRAINTRTMSSPSWGLRYTRRSADADLTALSTRDLGGGLVPLPGAYATNYAVQNFASQASVARANVHLGELTAGAVASDRSLAGGSYNRVLGPDFSWQPDATQRASGQLLLSSTTAQPDAGGNLRQGRLTQGHALFSDWFRGGEQWSVYGSLSDISDDFRDDNGFFAQVGYRDYLGELTRKLGRTGPWNEVNLFLHAERKFDHGGQVIADDYAAGVWLAGPLDSQLTFQVNPGNRVRVARDGPLFRTPKANARIEISPGARLAKLTAELKLGDVVDFEGGRLGKGGTLQLYGMLRPADWLELEPTYSLNWNDGKDGPAAGLRLYTETAAQLNAIGHLGAGEVLRLIYQVSSIRRDPALYARPLAALSRSSTTSLVYGRTAGLGTALYAGLTLARGETPGFDPLRRHSELFVKLSWQL